MKKQNTFKEGFPPTVVSDKYPVKNHSIKLTSIISEQEVFKEFEELGYVIIKYNWYTIRLICKELDTTIEIDTEDRWYESKYTDYDRPQCLTMKEHQLLHKLFKLWGWFDE